MRFKIWRAGALIVGVALLAVCSATRAGTIYNANGLVGGSRWDAAPRMIGINERSLVGGLRYSVEGGSFQAFRDQFAWQGSVPSVGDFQLAVEQAFLAWESIDPATGLGTAITFVPDLTTSVIGGGGFGTLNASGAEIDLLAENAGHSGLNAFTRIGQVASTVTLTSGTPNYAGTSAIAGSDVTINNNPGALYTLDVFRRLLTHELGHTLGLGDVEAHISPEFIDDNYDGTSSATALATLTNSWALLVDPYDPASSPLTVFAVNDADPGIDTPGVDILMESSGLGIAVGNPVTNLVPLTNDDYGTRQFLYPFLSQIIVPEPSTAALLAAACSFLITRVRRR